MSACPSPWPLPDIDFHAKLFDSLPFPAFVVDRDVSIIDFNLAAARLLEIVPFVVLRPSAGEVLHCIHSVETPEGCGHSASCHDCVIRNSVREVCAAGAPLGRRAGRLRLNLAGQPVDADFLVTVAPIPDEHEPVALLMLEQISERAAILDKLPPAPATSPASSSPGSTARARSRARKTGNS